MNFVSIYFTTMIFIPGFSDTTVKRYDKTSLITDEIWEEKIFEDSIKTSLITCLGLKTHLLGSAAFIMM